LASDLGPIGAAFGPFIENPHAVMGQRNLACGKYHRPGLFPSGRGLGVSKEHGRGVGGILRNPNQIASYAIRARKRNRQGFLWMVSAVVVGIVTETDMLRSVVS
jgi:hypothetical protein